MGSTGFMAFLRTCLDRDDAVGDLARDVVRDKRDGCLSAYSPLGITKHIQAHHSLDDRVHQAILDACYEHGRARGLALTSRAMLTSATDK